MTMDITVTNHAIHRYRKRFGLYDLPNEIVANVLSHLLREAIDAGRIATHKPLAFRVYGDRGHLKKGQRIAWSEDERVAVIFTRENHDATIITSLSRAATGRLSRLPRYHRPRRP